MAASHLVRLGKIKGNGKLLSAAKHNRRTIQKELGADSHIDARRINLNYSLAGADSPEAILANAAEMMAGAGIRKQRKDGVTAVEIVYSLPAHHNIHLDQYFLDCLEWTRSHFGCRVLSFDVHLDESTPHAHALILPLIDGRMVGSDLVGNRTRLRNIQADFFQQVGKRHGLQKPPTKLSGTAKKQTERAVLQQLKTDPVMRSALWPRIRDQIKHDPAIYAELLGLAIEHKRPIKSAVQIMTSKGKGSNHIGFDTS